MEALKSLGPSLGASFLDLKFKNSPDSYYSQLGDEVKTFKKKSADGKVQASAVAYTKYFFHKDLGRVKALIVANVRTSSTRDALVFWSESILPEILSYKKSVGADMAFFLLSKRDQAVFNFFIRPRKKRKDQVRFNHLRSLSLNFVQGQGFFADSPLEHLSIRTAKPSDLSGLEKYIKKVSSGMPLARSLDEDDLLLEFKKADGLKLKNLALAFDFENNIVGSLGVFDSSAQIEFSLNLDDVQDSIFLVTQNFLKMASWLKDLRPASRNRALNLKFFTHMYFNNRDIFYSLVCWWLKQTKKERSLFLYPHYHGDLKASPSESLHSSLFGADLFLLQAPDEVPRGLLRPSLFSPALDLDLHLLI